MQLAHLPLFLGFASEWHVKGLGEDGSYPEKGSCTKEELLELSASSLPSFRSLSAHTDLFHRSTIAGPLHHMSASWPASYIVTGTADVLIPPSHSHALYERLKTLGVRAELLTFDGGSGGDEAAGHGFDMGSVEGDEVAERVVKPVLAFLRSVAEGH